ncbi:MAG: guanylate kinase [Acidobacteriota bacterium]
MTGSSPLPAPAARLVVLSAPSGSGKTTLAKDLVSRLPRLSRSVSYTTRPRRTGEQDGVDYHFVDRSVFEAMSRADEFLEWAEIYGELYGTGREATDNEIARGHDLLLVIDVQGARWVKQRCPDAVFIFLLPPGYAALTDRLHNRGTESTGTETERLRVAAEEIRAWREYDYLIINDDIGAAGAAAEAVIRGARQARSRMQAAAEAVEKTFPKAVPGREVGL